MGRTMVAICIVLLLCSIVILISSVMITKQPRGCSQAFDGLANIQSRDHAMVKPWSGGSISERNNRWLRITDPKYRATVREFRTNVAPQVKFYQDFIARHCGTEPSA